MLFKLYALANRSRWLVGDRSNRVHVMHPQQIETLDRLHQLEGRVVATLWPPQEFLYSHPALDIAFLEGRSLSEFADVSDSRVGPLQHRTLVLDHATYLVVGQYVPEADAWIVWPHPAHPLK